MLEIQNLSVTASGKVIISDLNLKINAGETHCLMGPNGSGKSTLSLALMGHPQYQISSGKILLDKKDITALSPDKKAKLGLFLAMQTPVAIPGVSVLSLMKTAYKNIYGKSPQPMGFVRQIQKGLKDLKLEESFATRSLHDGFSGGEKKKIELLQISLLKPKYLLLDETDSGLDVDALKVVGEGIRKNAGPKVGVLLITHYQRILKYIKPDFVHVLVDGKIIKSGDYKLAEMIEEKGYRGLGKN
jgi:Fe-S cluster assembly ATP-binding protein